MDNTYSSIFRRVWQKSAVFYGGVQYGARDELSCLYSGNCCDVEEARNVTGFLFVAAHSSAGES